MSSGSSATAGSSSRSPSPPSPATPPSSHTLDPIVHEDLAAWSHFPHLHSTLSNDNSIYPHLLKRGSALPDLQDIVQQGHQQDSPPSDLDASPNPLSSSSPSQAFSQFFGEEANPPIRPRGSICSTNPGSPPLSHAHPESSLGSQYVVFPPKETCYNLPIMIPSIPEGGTKSRVETQVRLTVDLAHASTSSGELFNYDRVGSWNWLRLPKGTSTKRRSKKDPIIDAPPEDTLHLTTEISCASPPHTRVACCTSCQGREAKRVARKLAQRVRPAKEDPDLPEPPFFIPGRGLHEDNSNLVQFNCPEILNFSSGSVILPLRITCYCRHHREKVGFHVQFTMYDHTGRVVGSGTTRPIMITDDHKSTGINAKPSSSVQNLEWPITETSEPFTFKRKNARTVDASGEKMKKRTKPYDRTGRAAKLRRKNSNGSIASAPLTSADATRAPSRATSPAQSSHVNSPLPEAVSESPIPDAIAANEVAAALLHSAFTEVQNQGMEGVAVQDPSMLFALGGSSMSLDEFTNPSMFLQSEPTSPMAIALDSVQTLGVSPTIPYMLFNRDPPLPPALPTPKIHRLIPSSGPTFGGTEVTVLGANFHPAMQLNCVFGGIVSNSTTRWSDNTLVCLLPPRATPGVVPVWLDGFQKDEDNATPCLFTYTDETDRQLMELALQVVGLKMTGKIEEARNVAMRIVNPGPNGDSSGGSMNPTNSMSFSTQMDVRHLLLTGRSDNGDFEELILGFLAVWDAPVDRIPAASHSSAISHTSSGGQTLLHFACILNFPRVVAFLLAHSIDIDARDRNGYSALHFAVTSKSQECCRLLINAGAAIDIVNAQGRTAAELGPAGFFDSLLESDVEVEEEDAWADVEEDSSEEEVGLRPTLRRRPDRGPSSWRERHQPRQTLTDSSPESDGASCQEIEASEPTGALDDKKALDEKRAIDEKQAMAPFIEMVQRTLAQLQHPQAMIPQMPNLPLPQLRGMPAWGALPQMPAVFPVYVPISALPIPALSALWGERKPETPTEEDDSTGPKPGRNQQWLGIPTAQDWRGMWEKWMLSARNEESAEAPPAYTPRESEEVVTDVKVNEPNAGASTSTAVAVHPPAAERPNARRVGYEATNAPIPDQELNAYAYRPAKKQSRRTQKKHDRMLVLFWIPILLIGVIWAFLHVMRVGFHTAKAVLSINGINGLRL